MLSLLDAIRPTTLIKSQKLRDHLGLDVTIASETFQNTGSFKFRAAYNVALNIPNDEVIGVSSGNFGQALAYSCKLTGKRCTIVMPHNSAQVKIDAVRSYGAVTDLINVNEVSRADRVRQLAEECPDAYLASAYDDEFVIEGNSTLGDEIGPEKFDAVVVPVGGGGLISGTVRSFERNGVKTLIYGAEPLMANDGARSFRSGKLVENESEPQTMADGARTLSLGHLTWPVIKDGVTDFVDVPEERIVEAVKLYFGLANLKCEPTGALSLGAMLEKPDLFRDKKICVIVSGGNVDPAVYGEILAATN